ncbi:MAG: DUF4143 domain-containing protein [Coriobacteriales bacterium]|jgi:predicted AAA+ superfamily ATPase|nr:DUF4143 domain-containing protein [Coriobacteriales bacterium]
MYRKLIKELERWHDSSKRKPLIVYGARQVGKTWLLQEFGKQNYEKTAYILMSDNKRMQNLFADNNNATSIIAGLETEAGFSFAPQNTLIILDEIQEIPSAISSLKYIYEQCPEYHIAVAGSLLGVTLHSGTSFPVGKVNSLYLYPMSFFEFVQAIKSDTYANTLIGGTSELRQTFHDEYVSLLRQYLFVGGMPEAVQSFATEHDFFAVRDIQREIVDNYERDFSKHAPLNIVPRIQMVFDSVPSQLAKDNKKFIYGVLKKGARAKDYELAIQWLLDAGILHKVQRVNRAKAPLKHYEDLSAFKLFMNDIGLLGALSGLDARSLLEDDALFTEFKGALTEQFVAQQLVSGGATLYYYSSDDAKTEIDFMIEQNGMPIPIEVKATRNLKSKSLSNFIEKFDLSKAYKLSLLPYKENDVIQNLPLYLSETLVS